jgi:predicted phosphodiesterase
MKLVLISDVHVDLMPWSWTEMDVVPPDVKVAVVAGDISNDIWQTSRWMLELKERFDTVIWVAGNHDFYNHGFHRTRLHDPDLSKKWPYPSDVPEIYDHYQRWSDAHGIIFLHRRSVSINGVTFIGATGWHDYRGGEPYSTEDQIKMWYRGLSDSQIRWQKDLLQPDHLKPMDAGIRDHAAISRLVTESDGPAVVITHHIPHRRFLWQRLHDPLWTMLHGSFVNTMMEKIFDPKIKYWFYGHTHQRGMADIDQTTYVCNARGYHGENPGWEPLVLEV